MGAMAVTSDVISAGTALAGLILVYVGFQVSDYGSYRPTERKAVKSKFQLRVVLALIGVGLALLSALVALLAKAAGSENAAPIAVVLAVLAFIWTFVVAAANALEIK